MGKDYQRRIVRKCACGFFANHFAHGPPSGFGPHRSPLADSGIGGGLRFAWKAC